MVGVAVILGVSLFLGFGFVGWAATRGAKNVRSEYLKAGRSSTASPQLRSPPSLGHEYAGSL